MNNEGKKKYVYLIIGYLGLLLTVLAIVRYITIIQDTLGQALAVMGSILLISFLRFAENKIGVTTREKAIFSIAFVTILIVVLFILV
ncbi:hypothetical protein H8S33_18420 [Ornithinibacillus sp. BX22]|uniref:Uncharacterized protein n=1 Tax=Ornithinibacillus hominis TaxID=2763055 RepID=A0A923L8X3_9BACI|nr:hypothetical protein [Ornithinibacillus hominis]MBC5638748.1 hypothetical protein [Ornithinibacillus hominis]